MAELTQIQKVRNHLKIFHSITQWEATQKYNILRLAAVISELKKTVAIKSYYVQKGKKSFKRYYVDGHIKNEKE